MANFPASVSTNDNLFVAVNGLQTTLAVACTDTDTTLTLTSTSGFPTTGMVTIDNNEVVAYTGISGSQLTGCTRGADGTTALPHNPGVTVGLTVVAAHHNRLKDEIIAVENALGAGFTKGDLSESTSSVLTITGGTGAIIGSGTSIEVKQASNSQSGYLSSTDWSTFNNKQNALTIGNLSASSSKISISGGTGAVIGSGASIDLGTVTLDDLSNVTVPSPNTNDILTWNGSAWVNTDATTISLPLSGGTMTGDITMSNQKAIIFKETTGNGTDSVTIKAPASVTSSYTLQLPPALGSGNQTLVDVAGDGVLSWVTASGSGTVSIGTANQIAYYPSTGSTVSSSAAATIAAGGNLVITGTTTNDSADSGKVGEYVSASQVTNINFPTSTQYGDALSISLTAGDWNVWGQIQGEIGSATWSEVTCAISTTAGNSTSGITPGLNRNVQTWVNSSTTPTTVCVPVLPYRLSLASTTTVYLKMRATYSAGQPIVGTCSLQARRIR